MSDNLKDILNIPENSIESWIKPLSHIAASRKIENSISGDLTFSQSNENQSDSQNWMTVMIQSESQFCIDC